MVPNPVCAEQWQPLSFIRQSMLANSFSYLPVKLGDGSRWGLVSDIAIATYLRNGDRKERLAQTLAEAMNCKLAVPEAHAIRADIDVNTVLEKMAGEPSGHVLLVTDQSNQHLFGIVTPFDLL